MIYLSIHVGSSDPDWLYLSVYFKALHSVTLVSGLYPKDKHKSGITVMKQYSVFAMVKSNCSFISSEGNS